MLSALGAAGPPSGLEDRLRTFGQFVGSWDLEVSWFAPGGEVVDRAEGEWHFGWVLGGLAVQDVWIVPRGRRDQPLLEDDGGRGDYGTSLRFFDGTIDAWRSTWIGPVRGLVRTFVAREVAGDVVLTGTFEPGVTTRWSFTEITPTSFTWRNEERAGADGDWVLLQRFAALRA
jgi:hypothetical protein